MTWWLPLTCVSANPALSSAYTTTTPGTAGMALGISGDGTAGPGKPGRGQALAQQRGQHRQRPVLRDRGLLRRG